MKQTIRLTESELHNLIKNTVKRVVMEAKKADTSKPGKRFGKLDDMDVQEDGLDKNGNPMYLSNDERSNGMGRKTKRGNRFSSYKDFKPNESCSRRGSKSLREDFEQDYNNARNNYDRPLWGFEMKDSNNEWQYGDIQYDPKSQTMSCMGVTIDVDPDMTVDQNLEGLYEELMNQGYHDGDDEDEM